MCRPRSNEVQEFLIFLSENGYFVGSVDADLPSDARLLEEWREHQGLAPFYDPNHGDEDICVCGHYYYRHFDSYENMYPVGCKYCGCYKFESANIDPEYAEQCLAEGRCARPGCTTPPNTSCLPFCYDCEGKYKKGNGKWD